ncbi:nucleotidyltransferase family protein [Streptomyces sp. NPDC018693]|uniref:nucleotidyltransferase family protein n=1 Tax=unclassified Streptomyces TaxID=2593676 RepID=UPI00379A6D27
MAHSGEGSTLPRGGTTPDLRLATDTPARMPSTDPDPLPASPGQGGRGGLPGDRTQAILEAAKQVGSLLKRHGHRFAVAGSVAVYAHGGNNNLRHDADFCVLREDADAVTGTLREAGLDVRVPPEDWLVKTSCFGQDIDLIFELAHHPVTAELLARAQELPVDSVHMPVLAPTDLLWSLLAAFSEHHCDFGAALPVARVLREKVDWDDVRQRCGQEPMPAAFLFLLERLNIIAPTKEPS